MLSIFVYYTNRFICYEIIIVESSPEDGRNYKKEECKYMPKSWIKWRLNNEFTPTDPVEMGKLWMGMLQMVKADLENGTMTDWGECYNGGEGYALSELSVPDIRTAIMRYSPYFSFDIKPVLSADQIMDSIKKLST